MPVECLMLQSISIRYSKLRTLDLRGTPNLETLGFIYCVNLVELHMPVKCPKLKSIKISGSKLTALDLRGTWNLETLHVEECVDLVELHIPVEALKLKSIYIDGSKLRTLDLQGTRNLETLRVEECVDLSTMIKHLPDSICMLKHLKHLELNPCWLLEKLPEDIGRLECLETLILSDCVFLKDIPNSVCKMKRLRYFHLRYCFAVEKLPEELGRLECLKELNLEGTSIRHLPQSIFELKGLRIVGFRRLLESCGFRSEIQTSEDETFCYVRYVQL